MGAPWWKGVNVAQEEAWGLSCLACGHLFHDAQGHFSSTVAGAGGGASPGPVRLAWYQGEKGSWAPPHVVQTLITQTLSPANPTAITAEEYFNPSFELGNRDMGRPMELTTKTQK